MGFVGTLVSSATTLSRLPDELQGLIANGRTGDGLGDFDGRLLFASAAEPAGNKQGGFVPDFPVIDRFEGLPGPVDLADVGGVEGDSRKHVLLLVNDRDLE